MKHESAGFKTKKQLSAMLKKLANEKAISKITITDITSLCNLNRKTFYYHFHDVNAILKWTLEQEAVDIMKEYNKMNNFSEAISFTVDYICKNKIFLSNIVSSFGVAEIKYFFYEDFKKAILMAIDMHEKELNIKISETFSEFLSKFYAEALTSQMVNIITDKLTFSKDVISDYTFRILEISLREVIKSSESDHVKADNP